MTTPLLPPLTKREYFAAQAMPSFVAAFWANPEFRRSVKDEAKARDCKPADAVAGMATEFADALVARLAATAPAAAPPMTYGPPPPGYYESQEALRKALAAIEDPWTPYDGGPMPCAPSTRVRVKLRRGSVSSGTAGFFHWAWTGDPYDIVAWRKA